MNKVGILGIAIAAAFVAGSIFTGTTAFADNDRYQNDRDYDDKKHDDKHKDKTLESECAKKLEKKNLNLDGLFCKEKFAIQDMLDMVKDAVSDHETKITVLEDEAVLIMNQENCANGQVPKRDSDSLTGWSCQDDDTGDGGGGGPGDSAPKFRFEPQTEEPVTCTADTYGTMYYRDLDAFDIGPDALCICTIIEGSGQGEFEYMDIFSNNPDPCLQP